MVSRRESKRKSKEHGCSARGDAREVTEEKEKIRIEQYINDRYIRKEYLSL